MLEKIPTINMTRSDWLAERQKSIGGSDVGAILGMNRFRSPYSVWTEKTGRLVDDEDNEAMRQGRDLEQYVADRFTEKSGWRSKRYNYILRDPVAAPHLHANIDRKIMNVAGGAGLECKTASTLNVKSFAGGQFPESYYAQCVAYLAVTGWRRWFLAALVFGKEFHIYQITTIENDIVPEWCDSSVYVSLDEIKALTGYVSEWWDKYIAADVPPPVDGLESTTEAIKKVYADDNDETVVLVDRDSLLEDYFQLKIQQDAIEEQLELIKQQIQSDMGENSLAVSQNARVSWRTQEKRTFDWKAFQKANPKMNLNPYFKTTKSRVFRITKNKEEN